MRKLFIEYFLLYCDAYWGPTRLLILKFCLSQHAFLARNIYNFMGFSLSRRLLGLSCLFGTAEYEKVFSVFSKLLK